MRVILFSICILVNTALFGQTSSKRVDVVVVSSKQKVDILIDGKLFTSYNYPDSLTKPILYPVYASNGEVITRGYPLEPRIGEQVDHPHQVGVWFTFGDVNGLDFWNNSYAIPADRKPKYGIIRHQQVLETSSGSKGILKVKTFWTDYQSNVLLEEISTFIFTSSNEINRIDRTTQLTAIQKVVIKDNKEGLFAIRMDRAFEEPMEKPAKLIDSTGKPSVKPILDNNGVNGIYRNSEGIDKAEVWGKRARWVKLSAVKNNVPYSIAILDHKDNPGFPSRWMARGYGLFGINNLGAKVYDATAQPVEITLEKGQVLTFKHSLMIKSGAFLMDEELDHEMKP